MPKFGILSQPMEEEEEEETDFSKAKKALKMVDTGAGPKKKATRVAKVDSHVPGSSRYTVYYGTSLHRVKYGVSVCRWWGTLTAC